MNEAFHLLHRAGQRATELFAANSGGTGMTLRQYAVLDAIANSHLPSQTALVDITGVDRSTLADIVRRLVRRGLVHRRRTKADARAYQLTLTPRGNAEFAGATAAARATEDALLAGLPEPERAAFLDALGKISATSPAEKPCPAYRL